MKQAINPPEIFNTLQYGFSQMIASQGQTTLYLSGQVAWDKDENIVGEGDLGVQTQQSLRNIQTVLAHGSASMDDIVSMRIYYVERASEDLSGIGNALREFFPQDPPATTWLGVTSLANPAFLVEVEVIAVV